MDAGAGAGLTLSVAAAGLMLGGFVKGTIGIGLPLVAVPLLATVMPVPQAVALMVLPLLVTNLWQGLAGGHAATIVRRFWPMILVLMATIPVSATALSALDPSLLYLILGAAVVLSALPMLADVVPPIPPHAEPWAGPLVAGIAGGLGGVSSFFGPPIVLYMLGLHLAKDLFVATMAIVYLTGTIALSLTLAANAVLTFGLLKLSAAAVLPTALGMAGGALVRRRIDQRLFRRVVAVTLLVIGVNFGWKALS